MGRRSAGSSTQALVEGSSGQKNAIDSAPIPSIRKIGLAPMAAQTNAQQFSVAGTPIRPAQAILPERFGGPAACFTCTTVGQPTTRTILSSHPQIAGSAPSKTGMGRCAAASWRIFVSRQKPTTTIEAGVRSGYYVSGCRMKSNDPGAQFRGWLKKLGEGEFLRASSERRAFTSRPRARGTAGVVSRVAYLLARDHRIHGRRWAHHDCSTALPFQREVPDGDSQGVAPGCAVRREGSAAGVLP